MTWILYELIAVHESCTKHLDFRSQACMCRSTSFRNENDRLTRSAEGSIRIVNMAAVTTTPRVFLTGTIKRPGSRPTLEPFTPSDFG